jgi:hypothetical protein
MTLGNKQLLFIVGLGVLFFFPFLGYIHLFDWDEINFAESAREMIASGDYLRVKINYEPFWEKPPLFFWFQVIAMKVFGVNEFAARFPNAIAGIISLVVLFKIGQKLYDNRFGFIWSLLYLASFLPHLYFKSGIIDPIFNLFIFSGIYFLAKNIETDQSKKFNALLSGLFIGLAIITKGPVGLLLLLLTFIVYLFIKRFKVKIKVADIFVFTLSSLLITLIWFGYEIYNNGIWFIVEFIKYQIELFSQPVAGHEQPFYYHFIVVLLGCFPMSILAIKGFRKKNTLESSLFDFSFWMKILFWVVMILFSISKTKIVHYSSMAYLPLSFLAAQYLYQLIKTNQKMSKSIVFGLFSLGFIFSVLLILCPILFKEKDFLISLMNDPFAVASFNYDMGWTGYEFLIGVIYFIGLLLAIYFLKKLEYLKFLYALSYSAGFTLLLYSIFVVPKIEKFSQGPAVEFLESIAHENAYIMTVGYKSYAPYFYGKVKPPNPNDNITAIKEDYMNSLGDKNDFSVTDLNEKVKQWLMNSEIDKTAYFITKITKRDEMANYPDIEFIKNSGGFDFYKKEARIN